MEDDPEYVELVREAWINTSDEKEEEPPSGPSMADWSALHEVTANVIDEIRLLRATVAATVGGKEKPKFVVRPKTAMMEASESARITKRRLKHEALIAKLVPKDRE